MLHQTYQTVLLPTLNTDHAKLNSIYVSTDCANCHTTFEKNEISNKAPRKLQCGHTFCSACISNQLKHTDDDHHMKDNTHTLTCPTCSRVCQANSLTDIPIHSQLLEHLKLLSLPLSSSTKKKTKPLIQCVNCDQKNSQKYCTVCLTSLCESCVSKTHEAKIFAGHKIVSIEDKPPVAPECSIHKGKLCELYCLRDNVLMCLYCRDYGDHKDHENDLVINIATHAKQEIHATLINAMKIEDELVIKSLSILNCMNNVKSSANDADVYIDIEREKMLMSVNTRFDMLKQHIHEKKNEKIQILSDIQQNIVNADKKLIDIIKKYENIENEHDHFSVMNVKGRLIDDIQKVCLNSINVLESKENTLISSDINIHINSNEVIQKIKNVGYLGYIDSIVDLKTENYGNNIKLQWSPVCMRNTLEHTHTINKNKNDEKLQYILQMADAEKLSQAINKQDVIDEIFQDIHYLNGNSNSSVYSPKTNNKLLLSPSSSPSSSSTTSSSSSSKCVYIVYNVPSNVKLAFRVRASMTVNDELVYSDWSDIVVHQTPDHDNAWTLSESHSSGPIVLSNSALTASNGQIQAYSSIHGSCAFSTGIHEWSIVIDRLNVGGCIACGISSEQAMSFTDESCFLVSSNSYKWIGGREDKSSAFNISEGDIIHFRLDSDMGVLTITSSKTHSACIFNDLPVNFAFTPFFMFYTANSQFTLLPY